VFGLSVSRAYSVVASGLEALGRLNITCCRFSIVDYADRGFFLKLHQSGFERLGMRRI
jgi:hypothetical protein